MEIIAGSLYFISNEFFAKVNDPYLKINYESTKRPHYFAFLDNATGLQIASPNGHLCHIRRTARDIISGQAETH